MRVRLTTRVEDSHQFLGKYDEVKGHPCGGVFIKKGEVSGQDLIQHIVMLPEGLELTELDLPDLANRKWLSYAAEKVTGDA